MRARYISIALLAVACGRGSETKPDAKKNPDASSTVDGADVDAPVDGATAMASRVWAVGDWMTDNTNQAGGFDNGMAPAAVTIPAQGKLPTFSTSGNGFTNRVFDVSLDGAKIVYVADAENLNEFHLYFANADGTGATKLVPFVTGTKIAGATLSPDATKVAYLLDSIAIPNGFDLWVVNTQGTPAPVKISPDRPGPLATQDVFNIYTWSSDSKYLAFSADLTQDNFDQVYCTDTSVSPPVTVELLSRADIATQAMGAQGVRGTILFDSNNNVYFRARVSAMPPVQFQLFKAAADGSGRTNITGALPQRGDMTTPDIGAFAITPDGSTLVVNSDSPTALQYELYKVALPTATSSTKITAFTAAGHADFVSAMWISPDATRIAYVGNYQSTSNEPYVTKLDGSDTHRLVNIMSACAANCDAVSVQWAVDNSAAFVLGDLTVNNDAKVYRVDPGMTDQTPAVAVDVPTGGDVSNLIVRKK